ncbi:MAG: hypothetical protein ACK5OH_00660, partial [bacterium]
EDAGGELEETIDTSDSLAATALVLAGWVLIGSIEALGISRTGAGNEGRGTFSVDQSVNRAVPGTGTRMGPASEGKDSFGFGTLGTRCCVSLRESLVSAPVMEVHNDSIFGYKLDDLGTVARILDAS